MRNYLLLISFLISAEMVNAQDSVNSGGGTALSSAGFASFSIGQPFFVSQISATGAVYPGIQQGYEISSEDGLDIYPSVSVKAYPNPVTDYLNLSGLLLFHTNQMKKKTESNNRLQDCRS